MSNNKNSGAFGGCVLIFFAILLVFSGIRYLFNYKDIKAKEENEKRNFINFWKQENLNFFKTFDCTGLIYTPKEFEIDKFYSFEMREDGICDVDNYSKMSFSEVNTNLNSFEAEKIIDANVLILIKRIKGEQEANYEDGSRAIRYKAEINFIDIKKNCIYKILYSKCIGDPPQEIMKKGYTSATKDILFGQISEKDVSRLIESEINNN